MTAELLVMNRQAVALAADSAVTIQQGSTGKAFNSANKLFALSKYHPVGVMVYGGAAIMGVPWETVIKLYRQGLKDREFGTLEEYGRDLIAFLDRPTALFPPLHQEAILGQLYFGVLTDVRRVLDHEVERLLNSTPPVSATMISQLLDNILVKGLADLMQNNEVLAHLPASFGPDLMASNAKLFDASLAAVFQNHLLSSGQRDGLRRIVEETVQRAVLPRGKTGVVVAGFGSADFFPKFCSFSIGESVGNRLRYVHESSVEISLERSAIIRPFGQDDEIAAYIEGIDPRLFSEIKRFMASIQKGLPDAVLGGSSLTPAIQADVQKLLATASSNLFTSFFAFFEQYRREKHINPHLSTVEVLSKGQLAEFAETLVSLTSFRRQFSMELETVGGPVDVAVISKGDGFIWTKRKHYFQPERNHAFFTNYYRGTT